MKRRRCAVILFAVVLGACGACAVTPLPVSHPEYWSPEYGATDYPSLAASRDAGRD